MAAGIAVSVALVASCRTAPARRPEPVPLPPPKAEAHVASPAIRVGIRTDAARAAISASSGVVVWADGRSVPLPCSTFLPLNPALAPRLYRVQLASLRDEQAASRVSMQAQHATGETASVRLNPETGTYQVRVGGYESREAASSLAGRLALAGLPGGFVAEELAPQAADRIRLLESDELVWRALVVPARPGEELLVDGTPYRGVLELRAGEAGGLTLVNVVHLEDYLRGVVPSELSPSAFPQLEALKAQAIAARTYALRNLGQFASKGYDICATPSCQVYQGRGSEQPLSDEAVATTQAQIAAYAGKPINALYTSTCGGHTEDAANIFEGESAPYLRGVACAPERSAWSFVRSLASPVAHGSGESGLARDLALLQALGVADRELGGAALAGPAREDELTRWTSLLLGALGRQGCSASGSVSSRGGFFVHLVARLCWDERGRRLLAPGDADYLLQVEDRDALADPPLRQAAALLFQEGSLSPGPDNRLRPSERVTRAEALRLLAAAASRAGVPGLVSGEFRALAGNQLSLLRGEAVESFVLDREVRLFRALDGSRFQASELGLAPGDRVSLVLEQGRVTFLEAEQSRLGVARDRGSRYYRWEVRLTPEEVARSIARYGDVGEVHDLRPQRLGVSGRVIELLVSGTRGELLLTGLRIRWGLGLRENLFVVDRETRPDGSVARFVFTGKGWGHGVGLCQVGASSMAQAGADAESILKHYYRGITITKAY